MRLGKRERAAKRNELAEGRARFARAMRVNEQPGHYRSMWDSMRPHGKPQRRWELGDLRSNRPSKVRRIAP